MIWCCWNLGLKTKNSCVQQILRRERILQCVAEMCIKLWVLASSLPIWIGKVLSKWMYLSTIYHCIAERCPEALVNSCEALGKFMQVWLSQEEIRAFRQLMITLALHSHSRPWESAVCLLSFAATLSCASAKRNRCWDCAYSFELTAFTNYH